MQRTSIGAVIGAAVFMAAAAAILTSRFYNSMVAIPPTVSVTLWAMAVVCGVLAWKVHKAKTHPDQHGIGLDSSQLNPLTIARFLVVGKASAWTGGLVGGTYGGVAIYIIPRVGQLAAAGDDLTGVVFSVLGGAAMATAGIILERHCEVPPNSEASQALE